MEAHNSDKYKPLRFFSSHQYPAITPSFLERLKRYKRERAESQTATDKSQQPSNPYIILGLLSFCVLLLIANSVMAFKTIKTVEMPFGYIAQTLADQWYAKDLTLSSPDGISNVLFAEVILKGDFQANTKVYIEIDDHECEETYWAIPNQNVADYTVKFDCSNLVDGKTGGIYTAKVKTDKVAQNIYASLRFTYYNDPELDLKNIYSNIKANLGMHGTEYIFGDNATIFLQLYENNTAINDGTCLLDIFYPDKLKWKDNTPMTYLPNSDGLYYYDLVVPEQEGVYMVSAICGWRVEEGDEETADAFQIINGSVDSGDYTDTHTSNNDHHVIKEETDDEIPNLLAIYNFTGVEENDTIIELDIHLEYQLEYYSLFFWNEAEEDLNIEIYNFTGSDWYLIPQNITGETSDTNWDYGLTNGNIGDFIENGIVMIRFDDMIVDDNTDYFRIDHLYVRPKYKIGEVWDKIRGSGEMHVSSGNITATVGNVTCESVQSIENITNIEQSLNVTIDVQLEDLSQNISTTIQDILTQYQDVEIFGTEYKYGQYPKYFLQYLNQTDGSPINNAVCLLDVYLPNNTQILDDEIMTPLGSDGIYYKTGGPLAEIEGVYMLIARCLTTDINKVLNKTAYDDFESGGFTGGSGWSANWIISAIGGGSISVITTNPYEGTYHMRMTGDSSFLDVETNEANRTFTIPANTSSIVVEFYAYACSWEAGESATFTYIDGSGTEVNSLTLVDGNDDCTYHYYTYTYLDDDYDFTGTQKIRFYESVSYNNDDFDVDNVTIYTLEQLNESAYQVVRGGGELHVSAPEVNYTYFDEQFSSLNVSAEINQTWFEEKFNQMFLNQQQTYQWLQDFNTTNEYRFNITWQNQDNLDSYLQSMNTTIIDNQQMIISDITTVYNLLSDVYDEVIENILQSVA